VIIDAPFQVTIFTLADKLSLQPIQTFMNHFTKMQFSTVILKHLGILLILFIPPSFSNNPRRGTFNSFLNGFAKVPP